MRVHIGGDHAAYDLKLHLVQHLLASGHDVVDHGPDHYDAEDDYPVACLRCAEAVSGEPGNLGIVLGGSGNGEAIVANRVHGVRCALCWNEESARLGRQHNDANVISLGERMMPIEMALSIVRIWLDTPFEGGRHQHRIDLIDAPPAASSSLVPPTF